MAETKYDFSDFLSNGKYNDITWENGVTNTSIPYANSFNSQATTYYGPAYTGTSANDLEQNYAPYTQFTDYIVNGIKNKDVNTYKYLQWLVNKTSKDGVEGGDENLRISPYLTKIWDPTTNNFKTDLDWNSNDIQTAIKTIASNYATRRKDGKFGWYHLGPKKPNEITSIEPKKTPEIEIPGYTPYKTKTEEFKPISSTYPGWSDWIPLTMRKIVDDFAALKNNQLEKQKRYPRIEVPYKHQVVTDAYGQRTALEQQKQDVLRRADLMAGSDADTNLKQRMAAEEAAQKYSDAQLQEKENEYNQTKKESEAVLDWNTIKGVEGANTNRQYALSEMRNIINANKALIDTLKTNADAYIGDMYGNAGSYRQAKRINENALAANNSDLQKSYEMNNAYNEYAEKLQNIKYWPEFNNYIQTLLNADASDPLIGQFRDKVLKGELQPGTKEFETAAQSILSSSSDPSISKYKTSYSQYASDLESELIKKYQLADIDDKRRTYIFNPIVSNQIGIPRTLSKGGKMDRLATFAKLYAKEQESVRRDMRRRVNKDAECLNKALDRLSREQIVLLKSIFK